jgi:uncharacterized membrane protein
VRRTEEGRRTQSGERPEQESPRYSAVMTHPESQVLSVLVFALPPLTVLIAIPMILGWVRPNPWYGVRTRKTRSSPEIWYRANRVGGIYLTMATLSALAMWGMMTLYPMPEELRQPIDLVILAACQGVASLAILLQVRKM